MEYLLLISFIIHAVTFVVIRQMKIELDQPNKNKVIFDQQQKEIEELLAVYLLEIREENEKLLDVIEQRDNDSKQTEKVKEVNDHHPEPEDTQAPDKYQSYQPIEPEIPKDTVEQSLAAQVLSLYENGETPEAIAKQLNRGKREVELFIKFHRNQTE